MMLAFAVTVSSTSPIQAVVNQATINQNSPTQETLKHDNHQFLALSWGDIWRKLRRKKGKKGSRGPYQPKLCIIAPGKLKDPKTDQGTIKMWGIKPVFLWKGEIKGIEVRHIVTNELMWRQALNPTTNSIVYQGKPLKPGEAYSWRETERFSSDDLPNKQSFRIMKAEERDRISSDLKKLESELKPKGANQKNANQEKIVLARTKYFTDKGYSSDAFREIYSVQNPSSELQKYINQIQSHDFCAPDIT